MPLRVAGGCGERGGDCGVFRGAIWGLRCEFGQKLDLHRNADLLTNPHLDLGIQPDRFTNFCGRDNNRQDQLMMIANGALARALEDFGSRPEHLNRGEVLRSVEGEMRRYPCVPPGARQ